MPRFWLDLLLSIFWQLANNYFCFWLILLLYQNKHIWTFLLKLLQHFKCSSQICLTIIWLPCLCGSMRVISYTHQRIYRWYLHKRIHWLLVLTFSLALLTIKNTEVDKHTYIHNHKQHYIIISMKEYSLKLKACLCNYKAEVLKLNQRKMLARLLFPVLRR